MAGSHHHGCWEQNWDPLGEQYVLLTTDHFTSPDKTLKIFFACICLCCMCVWVHMCIHVCRGQESTPGVLSNFSSPQCVVEFPEFPWVDSVCRRRNGAFLYTLLSPLHLPPPRHKYSVHCWDHAFLSTACLFVPCGWHRHLYFSGSSFSCSIMCL